MVLDCWCHALCLLPVPAERSTPQPPTPVHAGDAHGTGVWAETAKGYRVCTAIVRWIHRMVVREEGAAYACISESSCTHALVGSMDVSMVCCLTADLGPLLMRYGLSVQAHDYTHKWAVYVRGPNNEDLSHIIKRWVLLCATKNKEQQAPRTCSGNFSPPVLPASLRVTFELHEDFVPQVRSVEQQPFEVNETGWGEFEIGITVCGGAAGGQEDCGTVALRVHADTCYAVPRYIIQA
eukprot:354988-Chlamydomonas_euryale.AAC.11